MGIRIVVKHLEFVNIQQDVFVSKKLVDDSLDLIHDQTGLRRLVMSARKNMLDFFQCLNPKLVADQTLDIDILRHFVADVDARNIKVSDEAYGPLR